MQNHSPLAQTQATPFDLSNLPPARFLTLEGVRIWAREIASHFVANPPGLMTTHKSKIQFKTAFYGVTITSTLHNAVILRSQCKYFWRSELEKKANKDRLHHEAKNRIVGKVTDPKKSNTAQIYCSDETLQRAREKKTAADFSLASQYVINTQTGQTANLLDIVKIKEAAKVAEIYNFCKSLERLSDNQSFSWLFITLTAPSPYHPNPLVGKNCYNKKNGIKDGHEYINKNWKKIRAILNRRGIPASPETYFGFRTVEPHQDGSIHWHLIVFTSPDNINNIKKAIREKFETKAAADIMLGETGPGSAKASSYIFKYITKSFSKKEGIQNDLEKIEDARREAKDLASIRNKERVQATIKALNIRQFQLFGVRNLITTFRKINSLKLQDVTPTEGSTLEYINNEIWRNPNGYFNMLSNPQLFGSYSKVNLIMEHAINAYGEQIKKCTGIQIGGTTFSNNSVYKIERYQNPHP